MSVVMLSISRRAHVMNNALSFGVGQVVVSI
jgi:hypothetical protein